MEIGPGRGQLPGVRRLARDSEVDAPARASLFEGLSRRELIQLAKATEDLAVPAGKQFCRKGTTGSELFVIVEGEAAVTEGRRRINTLPPGDVFGEIALDERTRRTAAVTALTPARSFAPPARASSRCSSAPRASSARCREPSPGASPTARVG